MIRGDPASDPAVIPDLRATRQATQTLTDGHALHNRSHATQTQPQGAALDLCSFLSEYGIPLRARCPRHPETQLMVDPGGRFHLLRQVSSTAAQPYTEGRPSPPPQEVLDLLRGAVIDLIGARSWVKEHMSLLQLTEHQLTVDHLAEPVLHLFTEHAKLAVALVKKLDSLVVIHLLQEIRVGAERTWYCVELNEPRGDEHGG